MPINEIRHAEVPPQAASKHALPQRSPTFGALGDLTTASEAGAHRSATRTVGRLVRSRECLMRRRSWTMGPASEAVI